MSRNYLAGSNRKTKAVHRTHEIDPGLEWKTGTVESFSFHKQYGYIRPDGGGGEVYVDMSAVQRSNIRRLEAGCRVRYREVEFGRGETKAVSLEELKNERRRPLPTEFREQHHVTNKPRESDPIQLSTDRWYEATVKWFNREERMGFVTLIVPRVDVFLHLYELQRAKGVDVNANIVGLAVKVMVAPNKKDPSKFRVSAIELRG